MTIDPPEISRHVEVSIPDHKVLLSFTNDEDAVLFCEWWERHGLSQFTEDLEIL